MRTVYLNGEYVAEDKASVSVFDRGFLFADAIYEVTSVVGGKLLDFPGHCARLRRSIKELDMPFSLSDDALLEIHRQLVQLNQLDEGMIYLQVTRGVADRDFHFPAAGTPNTVLLFTMQKPLLDVAVADQGISVVTLDDLRWQRCDIKTVQLLYASMAKMQAKSQGADDAWLLRDGFITEGTSNNAFIVSKAGTIVTRDISNRILSGITRKSVMACAALLEMPIEQRAFSVAEVENAQEAFSTSASTFVMPVVTINGKKIGDGKPGVVSKKLRQLYIQENLKSAL